jgi:PAS domain S-box-containing protein
MAMVSNEEWLRLLAVASRLLGDPLAADARLGEIAELAVPRLGDWCCIVLAGSPGQPARWVHAAGAAAGGSVHERLRSGFPFRPGPGSFLARVFREGRPEVLPEIRPEACRDFAPDPEKARQLANLDLRSLLLVPLRARGRALGTICFGVSGSLRRYGEGDKTWGVELADRIALSLAIARSYREADSQAERLRRSESLYRALADNIPALAWMTDPKGAPLYFNRRCAEYAGRPLHPEMDETELHSFIHPDDLPALREARREGFARAEAYGCDFRMRRVDGEFRWHLSRNVPVPDADGNMAGWFGSALDVHELRQQIPRPARRGRPDGTESIGRVAGGIAHGFNNLLTAINGYADLLLPRLAADPVSLEYVGEIRRAGDIAAGLTGQMLAYGRRQMLLPSRIDLGALLRAAAPMLANVLGEGIRVAALASGPLEPVLVDQAKLQQALLQLALNARDAMPRGGTLTLSAARERLSLPGDAFDAVAPPGDYMRVTVEDTGTGIDPKILPRICEPFFSTKEVGSGPAGRTGTGLGLSMVLGFVDQSGGYLQVDSVPGRGSRFSLLFPLPA